MAPAVNTIDAAAWLTRWAGKEISQPGSGPGLLGALADGVVSKAGLPDSYGPQVLAEICAAVAGALDTVMAKYQSGGK